MNEAEIHLKNAPKLLKQIEPPQSVIRFRAASFVTADRVRCRRHSIKAGLGVQPLARPLGRQLHARRVGLDSVAIAAGGISSARPSRMQAFSAIHPRRPARRRRYGDRRVSHGGACRLHRVRGPRGAQALIGTSRRRAPAWNFGSRHDLAALAPPPSRLCGQKGFPKRHRCDSRLETGSQP